MISGSLSTLDGHGGPSRTARLKVVHLITSLNAGGAQAMLQKLLDGMDHTRTLNVVISLMDRGALGQALEAGGTQVYALGMRRGRMTVRGLWSLMRLLRRERPDILQTWLYHADLLGLLVGRAVGIRHIVWNIRCSDMEMRHYSRGSAAVRKLLAYLSRWPDAVVVNSRSGLDAHRVLGYRPRRCELIPNGFDLERFRPRAERRSALRDKLGVGRDAFLIGLVARFDPMKGHAAFLEAAESLACKHAHVAFVLVGSGVDEGNQHLMRLVGQKTETARVLLMGERGDVEAILQGLDVLTLSSAFGEGFPNVLGEAMACAVPCVTTDVGDAASIVGDTGFVVPPADPQALVAAWDKLVTMPAAERERLGTVARERIASHFSLAKVVEAYEGVYRTLSAQPRIRAA